MGKPKLPEIKNTIIDARDPKYRQQKGKKEKKEYYNINDILEVDAQYNIILGERSNGKSYAIKKHCVDEAYNKGVSFVLIRRYATEITNKEIGKYFDDCPIQEISHGECTQINIMRGEVWACNYDADADKVVKIKFLGWIKALHSQANFKSAVFKDCGNIIFEEFVTTNPYLPNEPTELQSLISTVFRRRTGKVWLIGNKISRINPYYGEWGLRGVPRQQEGTIELYTIITDEMEDETNDNVKIKIAVQQCDHTLIKNRMFFGASSKMTTDGEWEIKTVPHLPLPIDNYYVSHRIYFMYSGGFELEKDYYKFEMLFLVDKIKNGYFWYIIPKTTEIKNKDRERIISDAFSANPLHTNNFSGLNDKEERILRLLKVGKVCFADNLTGADFYDSYKFFN